MTTAKPAQPAGITFGPRVPHIAFFFGDMILGEVRLPSGAAKTEWIQNAKSKLSDQLQFFNDKTKLCRLFNCNCTYKIYH